MPKKEDSKAVPKTKTNTKIQKNHPRALPTRTTRASGRVSKSTKQIIPSADVEDLGPTMPIRSSKKRKDKSSKFVPYPTSILDTREPLSPTLQASQLLLTLSSEAIQDPVGDLGDETEIDPEETEWEVSDS